MKRGILGWILSLLVLIVIVGYLAIAKNLQHHRRLTGVTPTLAEELYYPQDNAIGGNPDGSITMVEFFGYNCEYCRKYFPNIQRFIRTHPQLRVIYKEYLVFGGVSREADYAALAAHRQGKYLVMHDAMMSQRSGTIGAAQVIALAEQLHLNVKQLLHDMQDIKLQAQIERNTDLAGILHITGAPTVLFIKTAAVTDLSGRGKQVKPYILSGGLTLAALNRLYKETERHG
ncbi:MAG: thioredoxin domain-containing protein [Gammaproteobacteria bacterium]|nr:thioredoxin domain-containing protein [Gammaproteobacteria bacterium]